MPRGAVFILFAVLSSAQAQAPSMRRGASMDGLLTNPVRFATAQLHPICSAEYP